MLIQSLANKIATLGDENFLSPLIMLQKGKVIIMKKTVLLTILASMCIGFAACAPKEEAKAPEEPTTNESVETQEQPQEGNDNKIVLEENLYVADAAMYRGTITNIEETEDGKKITLEQAQGTDFGAEQVVVNVTNDTDTSFEDDKLVEGAYLEVFYGGDIAEEVDAIAMNIYFETQAVIFNGTLKEIVPTEGKENEGRIFMQPLEGEEEIIFNYGEETQFYLNVEELKEGDALNIFHKGILTRSIPPQGIALEVRTYAE